MPKLNGSKLIAMFPKPKPKQVVTPTLTRHFEGQEVGMGDIKLNIVPQNTKKPTSKSMEAGFNYVGSEGLEPPTPSV